MTAHALVTDPIESAKLAGLRYVNDHSPGFSRLKQGKSFIFLDSAGKKIRDKSTLARLKSLVIPPAWRSVWICPWANGHIQATGFDQRKRKQYLYHPQWRQVRDENKYARMIVFAQTLPKIRERVKQDIARQDLTREKVLAALVQLLEKTLIRIGNVEYAKANQNYGLTTMLNRHVDVKGSTVHFKFRGKSNIYHEIDLKDKRLAKILSKLQDLPGQDLFQYLNDQEEVQSITSSDVNAYIHEIAGEEFTAKDFRTWAGTVLASLTLQEFESFENQSQAKKMSHRRLSRWPKN